MRIVAAKPVKEGLARRAAFQKSAERDAGLTVAHDAIANQGKISRAAVGPLCFTRPPGFAGGAAGDAGLGEGFAKRHELRRKIGLMIRRILELPGIASGEDGGAGRCALRRRGVGVIKDEALFGQTIDVRRLHPAAAIRFAEVARRIVRDDKEHVGPGLRCCRSGPSHKWSEHQRGEREERGGAFHKLE